MNLQIADITRDRPLGLDMSTTDISGATEISDGGIKKHFKNLDPYRALFELVWNSLDARAGTVKVDIQEQPLGGVVRVVVSDDGEGIDFLSIKSNFGRFNDSDKREDDALHGSHGRGRLAFHRLAREATWYTKNEDGEAVITISSDDVKLFKAYKLEDGETHGRIPSDETGTVVELRGVSELLPEAKDLRNLFSNEFGWILVLNPTRKILVGGISVSVPSHEIYEEDFKSGKAEFKIKVIRWNEKQSSEQSYTYLLNSSSRQVYRQYSTLNRKHDFYTSVYVQSSWADNFVEKPTMFDAGKSSPESEEWRALTKYVFAFTRQIYEEFLKKHVEEEIQKYEEEGIFPSYAGLSAQEKAWRLENAKGIVRSIYTADPSVFTSLKTKQKKILIRLLDRIAVSDQNESIFEVLNSVLELDKESVETLASQLRQTTLKNIVSTIELLQRRQLAVHQLRELMNEHYATVLETPDLQKIIENNTWLFGPQYEILGAEEVTFAKVAKELRDSMKDINLIESGDVEEGATVEGANRQPDLFLARKVTSVDSFGKAYYRCIVVEIKRPSVSLNVKHLRQLEDYSKIIKKCPEFTSGHFRFELILIGRKISSDDTEIIGRLSNQLHRGEVGLEYVDDHMKRYILNWYTLLDGFELTNNALLEKLKLQRESLSASIKEQLVESLQGGTS